MSILNNGVRFQQEALTPAEADSAFAKTCRICASKGLCPSCDGCPVAAAHKFTVDTFALMEEVNASLKASHRRVLKPAR